MLYSIWHFYFKYLLLCALELPTLIVELARLYLFGKINGPKAMPYGYTIYLRKTELKKAKYPLRLLEGSHYDTSKQLW